MSLVPIHLSFILNSFRPFCSLDTQPVSAFVWILVVACVARVWKGREREFKVREKREGRASRFPRAQNPLSLPFQTPGTQAILVGVWGVVTNIWWILPGEAGDRD